MEIYSLICNLIVVAGLRIRGGSVFMCWRMSVYCAVFSFTSHRGRDKNGWLALKNEFRDQNLPAGDNSLTYLQIIVTIGLRSCSGAVFSR